MSPRTISLVVLGATFAATVLGTACSSSSSRTATFADTDAAADGNVPSTCPQLGCAATPSLTSTCGWKGITSTCSGGASCDGPYCYPSTGGAKETCNVTATANDGTILDLQFSFAPAGCGVCATAGFSFASGGAAFTGPHVCKDGGTGSDAGQDAESDAGLTDATDDATD